MTKSNQVLFIRQKDVEEFFELLELFKEAASELLETDRVPEPYTNFSFKPAVDRFYKQQSLAYCSDDEKLLLSKDLNVDGPF